MIEIIWTCSCHFVKIRDSCSKNGQINGFRESSRRLRIKMRFSKVLKSSKMARKIDASGIREVGILMEFESRRREGRRTFLVRILVLNSLFVEIKFCTRLQFLIEKFNVSYRDHPSVIVSFIVQNTICST